MKIIIVILVISNILTWVYSLLNNSYYNEQIKYLIDDMTGDVE